MESDVKNHPRTRKIVGVLCYLVLISVGFSLGLVTVVTVGLILLGGGFDLLLNAWRRGGGSEHAWLVYTAIFTGGIFGLYLGAWLWSHLMRKTHLLSMEEMRSVTGLRW